VPGLHLPGTRVVPMTTPPESRRDQRTRSAAAAIVALVAAVLTLAGPPGPASAAAPPVAQKWSSLMYHSLTPTPAYVQLRKTLATQRATLATRAHQLTAGRAAHGTAQTGLTAAVTADAAARTRSVIAREALTSARNTLTLVSQRRPRSGVAVTRAKNAITAAATIVTTRRTQAREAAAALKTALAASRTATVNLDRAAAAWETAYATVRTNQQKLIALDHSAELAAQAAALSRDVVTEVRTGFVVADSTTVYGVTVHNKVAFAFKRMLDAAKADGIVLSGGGFRTKAAPDRAADDQRLPRRLDRAGLVVPGADGDPGPLAARDRPGHRHHLRRQVPHRRPVPHSGGWRARRRVRLREPAVRAVALVDHRRLNVM
jgi:D-alanyl-D-alanine carboxypeptidase